VRKVLRDAGPGSNPLLRDIVLDAGGGLRPARLAALLNAALGRVAARADGFVDLDAVPDEGASLQARPYPTFTPPRTLYVGLCWGSPTLGQSPMIAINCTARRSSPGGLLDCPAHPLQPVGCMVGAGCAARACANGPPRRAP